MSLADGSYFIFNNERFAGQMLAKPRIIGPLPVVLLDQSVTPVKCEIEKRGQRYIIKFGGVGSIVHEDYVYVLLNEPDQAEEWVVILRENLGPDLYTIETYDCQKGWVAPENDDDPKIMVKNLIVGPSLPPFFPPNELFRIVPA